jgi:uncharacterized protein (TIGR02271 family)
MSQRKIPVAREELEVRRKRVDRDTVRVRTLVHEREAIIDEPLVHDEVEVRRMPVNRVVDAPSGPREEGDLLIVPVFEEVITVQRKWMLKEEVHISRRRVSTRHHEQVPLRSEEAVIEREAPPEKR